MPVGGAGEVGGGAGLGDADGGQVLPGVVGLAALRLQVGVGGLVAAAVADAARLAVEERAGDGDLAGVGGAVDATPWGRRR